MPHQRTRPAPGTESFLLTSRVADLLQVSPKTLARWAQHGLLPFQRTLGGHRCHPEPAIRQLLASLSQGAGA
jgi:excisionase family DNA binding protein